MITIQPSKTADTRTCDVTKVTREQLLASSVQHIEDVGKALAFFGQLLTQQAVRHDTDKLTDIDGFYDDFVHGFSVGHCEWWQRHRRINRHHLTMADGVPSDVNLIDVLDFIADCVMAGMGRSGSVYPLNLPPELLERAFQNTVTLLKSQVVVVTEEQCDAEYPAYGLRCQKPKGHEAAHRGEASYGSIQWPQGQERQ